MVLIISTTNTYAQYLEGQPLINNFDNKSYGAHQQNWDVIQDDRGVLYFGNTTGLLEYDGVNWELQKQITKQTIRSINKDKNGLLVFGTYEDFGYLTTDTKGKLTFESLKKLVPTDHYDFGFIAKVHCVQNGVYFQSLNKIFFWDYKTIKVITTDLGFHLSFLVDNQLFIKQNETGLMKLNVKNELELVNGGEEFMSARVYCLLPYSSTHYLVGTREKGFYLLSKNNTEKQIGRAHV